MVNMERHTQALNLKGQYPSEDFSEIANKFRVGKNAGGLVPLRYMQISRSIYKTTLTCQ